MDSAVGDEPYLNTVKISGTGKKLIAGSVPFTVLFLYYLLFVVSTPILPAPSYLPLVIAVPSAIMAAFYGLSYVLVYRRSLKGSPETAMIFSLIIGFVVVVVVFLLPLSIALWTFSYVVKRSRDREFLKVTGHRIDENVYTSSVAEDDAIAFNRFKRRVRIRKFAAIIVYPALVADLLYLSVRFNLLEALMRMIANPNTQFPFTGMTFIILFFYIPFMAFLLLLNNYERYSMSKLYRHLPGKEAVVIRVSQSRARNCTISIEGIKLNAAYVTSPQVGDTVIIRSVTRRSGILAISYITVDSMSTVPKGTVN